MRQKSLARLSSKLSVAAVFIAGAASAADIHVMISAGFYRVYAELGPAFERASGHRLVTTRGPSMGDSPEAIPSRLARGETADVVILDGGAADELGRRGWVRAGSKVDLARSLIGMVVRAGAAKPDIGSVETFRSTLLAAKSIAYSDSGSGTYLSTLPMSGFAAPARTTMPISDRARSTLLPARTNPRLPSSSAAPPSRITTSAVSPRARRVGIASGESPIDGPRVVTRWWPLARSKAGTSSEYAP